jgi:RNA polymerase sigma-70 factor (ECF subfamily)
MADVFPNDPSSDDTALIRAAQAMDAAAFEALVERHMDGVRAFIALRLPVAHVVDELTHETFVFAFRQMAHFTAGTSFRTWLRAIAANLIRAELQRYRRQRENEANYAQHCLLQAELEQAERMPPCELEYLKECMERLPTEMRELLDLKYRRDISCADIAMLLRRTETWVWQNLHRMRQQLRQCIEGKLTGGAP